MANVDSREAASGTIEIPRARRRPKGIARFWRSGQLRLGVLFLVVASLVALIGPFVTPYDPSVSIGLPYAPPGDGALLGTDMLGRDVLSRVLAGGSNIIWMAPVAALVSTGLGAAVGLAAAYFGGAVDTVLMRLMDFVLAFPSLVFTLLFVSIIGPQPWLLVVLVAIALLPGVARVVRGTAQPVVGREYVQWAKTVGMPSGRILRQEILPNITSPLFVELGIRLMISINLLASLSFIGYGIQPPTPDWGLMVSENRTGLSTQAFSVLAPIVLIVLFTVGGNLISEGAARVMARTEGRDSR